MLKHFRDEASGVLAEIRDKQALTDELSEQIKTIVNDFKSHWVGVDTVV